MKASLPITMLLVLGKLQAYQLHEWGTFTTVSGSDGILLNGLEREEESLPGFVKAHPGFENRANLFLKALPLPVRNVKVKMETPVIYFHSADAFRATVKVGFNGGTISQWYPARSGGEVVVTPNPHILPKPQVRKILDFSKPYSGSIEWEVDVLSQEQSREAILFKPGDNLQWTHARVPEANVVRSGDGETEGFLFYRGVGSFDPGLNTTVSADDSLHLTNHTGGSIPYLLIYERHEDGGHAWHELPAGLAADASLAIPKSLLSETSPGFDAEMYKALRDGLAARGLLKSEADAMVRTWWHSYFEAPGLRVFWVLPDLRTNAILPLDVAPAPDKTVRVLVGRSEVLRPSREQTWLADHTSAEPERNAAWNIHVATDRFGLAHQERILSLLPTASLSLPPSPPSLD